MKFTKYFSILVHEIRQLNRARGATSALIFKNHYIAITKVA
jgi:hypothetical protein